MHFLMPHIFRSRKVPVHTAHAMSTHMAQYDMIILFHGVRVVGVTNTDAHLSLRRNFHTGLAIL